LWTSSRLAALSSTTLIRWGGLAAVLAGALRAAVSFWPSSDPDVAVELLYLLIDILILFGILGVYGFLGEQSGVAGFLGFLVAVIGTAIITGPDGEIGGVDMYAAGSAMLALGLVLLAVGSWKAARLPHWVSVLWVLTAVLGLVGGAVESLDSLFVVSGVAFGVSFIGAGVRVWAEAGSTAPKTQPR
jgi:hypothetical protein